MARVQYVGHATVLVELDGVRLLTDPLLRSRIAQIRRAVPLDDIAVDDLDAVLISHGHYDHLDKPSLRLIPRSPTVVAPRGLGARLQGFDAIELEENDEVTFGPVRVRATHAEHAGARPPWSGGTALGYAILGSKRIFFAGDTDLFDGMSGLVDDLDLALIPIWGWGATLGRGKHMDPERAAEAVRRLRPRIAVPIHWATYRPLHRSAQARFLIEPGAAFVRATAEVSPDVEVRLLRPGEHLSV
jgi:L-ascorbate metabolism protein UlaG (beta-lactamase superfamily)